MSVRPAAAGVSRRDFFSLGARRVLPDEEGIAALGEALREFHDAEAGIDRDAEAAREDDERSAVAGAEALWHGSWSRGDLAAHGGRIAPAADALVAATGIGPGSAVLDVGAGDGTLALAAAAAGARVTALDLSPDVVVAGRSRARGAGAQVDWHVGDATSLPFGDATFDCAVSNFGAIFASPPQRVTAELGRVTRPGGAVGLTAWAPAGLMGRVLDLTARLSPPPPSVGRPSRWGRFESAFLFTERTLASFAMTDHELVWAFSDAEAAVAALIAAPGPLGVVLAIADEEARASARDELLALVRAFDADADAPGVRLRVAYCVVAGCSSSPPP